MSALRDVGDVNQLPDAAVTLGAGVGAVLTHGLACRRVLGPDGWWWVPLQRALSRAGAHVDERLGPRPITDAEYAGTLDMPPALAGELLWERGFVRNPFARLKHRDGEPECGSWAYRESWLSFQQLHLMLFPGEGCRTDVYAHEEASSVNPIVGPAHFDGDEQNVKAGVEWARAVLPLEIRYESPEPPAGPWTAAQH